MPTWRCTRPRRQGKSRFAVFEPTMHAAIVERHALSSELSRSIGRGELLVYYQPIVDLDDGAIHGVEALVRWRHPGPRNRRLRRVHPAGRGDGTILALGRWVLFEACREAAAWRARGPQPMAPDDADGQPLGGPAPASRLRRARSTAILDETGLPAAHLVLEMTEKRRCSTTPFTTFDRLEALRALGVRIAIDDFGTGYSSLGYLRRFQVDILKIAREFIGPRRRQQREWAFARAIVALGRTLSLRIVAEGIEEPGQLERLRAMGCEIGQGFLFADAGRRTDHHARCSRRGAPSDASRAAPNGRAARDGPARSRTCSPAPDREACRCSSSTPS